MPKAQATAIASMLCAALGNDPQTDESDERIRLEATVPAALRESVRLNLLAFLVRTADRFGHDLAKDGTSRIWVEVDRQEDTPVPLARRCRDGGQYPPPPGPVQAGIQARADESEGPS